MSTRDMNRARAILDMLYEYALQAAMDKSHKRNWVGTGLRERADSIMEEAWETCQDLIEAEPNNPEDVERCKAEAGQLVWSAAIALDDSGMGAPFEEAS